MKFVAFEKSVGGIIYWKQEDKFLFLLVQYRSWQWDFPKGHVEQGESEIETMKREVFEETKIKDLEILPNFRVSASYFYTAKGNEKIEREKQGKGIYIFKKAVFFAAQTKQRDVEIDFENKAFLWLSFEQVMQRLGNDGSKKIMRALAQRLKIS